MKQIFFVVLISLYFASGFTTNIKITLDWDEFEGECTGYLNGSIDGQHIVLNGSSSQSYLNGSVSSKGEGFSSVANQVFEISLTSGFFTFWIKDKFGDQDINPDPDLISKSKPIVKVFKNNQLWKSYNIEKGQGLTCKVFSLDIESDQIEKEIKFFPKSRLLIGKIVDAVNGEALSNAVISAKSIANTPIDLISNGDGYFIIEAEIGNYSLSISKEGYITNNFDIRMKQDENPREFYVALSPETKEFRIVLTWGSRPRDLDAHLSGPKPNGDRFHIWYRNRILIDGKDFLDRDDTDKFGPETITIYKPAYGEYLYSVHDYSNKLSQRSMFLSNSNALVQVYRDNKLLNTFEIPQNQNGTVWNVFKINESQQIIPINTITFVNNERNIH